MLRKFHLPVGVGLILTVCGCASALIPSDRMSFAKLPLPLMGPIRTVVVDAGHGGKDPGASHFGLQEKHLALDMARHLRSELKGAGLEVVMTREGDQFLDLSRRAAVANRVGAGMFVSVHVNASRSRRLSGAEVYYPRTSVVAANAQWPPSVTPAEVQTSSATIKKILWDMVLGRTRAHSHQLAATVCDTMKRELAVRCKVKSARFVVLREARMPAVLVEVGYVSNRAESKRLNRAGYRSAAARAIANGIVAYIRRLELQHI